MKIWITKLKKVDNVVYSDVIYKIILKMCCSFKTFSIQIKLHVSYFQRNHTVPYMKKHSSTYAVVK